MTPSKFTVTGTYVFHRGEELRWGCSIVAKEHQEFLQKFTHAIAFDRKGISSVITKNSNGICCSMEFAIELSKRLSNSIYIMRPDNTGIFSDIASYIDYIPECTNISVGYYNNHRMDEFLDLNYLLSLRDIAIKQETWDNLPIKRNIK